MPLLTDHYEETILLDKTKPQENLAKEATNSIAQESPLSLPINTLISQVLQAAKHQDKDMSAVQLTLQMIVTASLLLQGTWFIQVCSFIFYGKNFLRCLKSMLTTKWQYHLLSNQLHIVGHRYKKKMLTFK